MSQVYEWSVVGAGPAGMAVVGSLIDNGVKPSDILWVDPNFAVGDFGKKWGEVSSNTSVALFIKFLEDIKAFDFKSRAKQYKLETYDMNGFTQLKDVTTPLQFATDNLIKEVSTVNDYIEKQSVSDGSWELVGNKSIYRAKKVVLATGATPKALNIHDNNITQEIELDVALSASKLQGTLSTGDKVAVIGSSHSAMIIIRSLIESGVTDIANFYIEPLKYAIKMGEWTLYDNTGLKGETAKWVRKNISQNLDTRIHRYLSTSENIKSKLGDYNKVIYATGFDQRAPATQDIDLHKYDHSNGIIAPGLFGCGIAFPRQVVDPNGNREMNVGLFKFMKDIRNAMPIWIKYDI
jgi:hypothetical protein